MNSILNNPALHISAEKMLERSRWFGPSLITFLISSEDTGNSFALLKCTLKKEFQTPLHIHTKEDESLYILEGDLHFQIAEQEHVAKPGEFVYFPRLVPHSIKPMTETVTLLLFISPGGFEEKFRACSTPALTMELPPVSTEPKRAFFEQMTQLNEKLGVFDLPIL